MDKYIYLIAQLPSLVFDKTTFMNVPLFLEEAEKWMSARDLRKLGEVQLLTMEEDSRQPAIFRQIVRFENEFRQELAEWRRAVRKGNDYKPRFFPVSMVKEGNPLEVEKKLLYLRWQFIENLEQEHHFDLDLLILYYLKLQILQKLASYDKETGMERFQKISKVSE